jgi:serine/threonine-protein kinase
MNTHWSIPLLESALAGNLPQDEEVALQRHLEECEACNAALEQLAGGATWCREAQSLLAEDELDAGFVGREPWSEVDFTVEHLEPADDPKVLGRLGGYDVLEVIGHGGMGVVLKAFDRELKRLVAIKVLSPHLAQNSLARKRFAREAQAAAAVVHQNVLAIHQVQPGGRLPFLVMPLVSGESVAERLKRQGTLELKEVLRIGMQAAAGLAAAHEQGLVHRDVKPANILLEKGIERTVLTDFGLARAADDVTLTRWGAIAGTPQYMSPEQARGEALDGRSDLFSLGCVLYEMATGVSPFRADSVMATMRRLVDDAPQSLASLNPELPPWFIAIVDRLLEKDPARRFNTAQEVSELLEGCLAHVQQPASAPLPVNVPAPVSGRNRWSNFRRKGVFAMLGIFGIGLLGIALVSANPPDIAGEWTGEDWGTVVLEKMSDTEYRGRYLDGEIHLNWSRIERRFNGTWSEGKTQGYTADGKALVTTLADRFGDLSVRLVGDEIRGALTTDPKSRINPATPRLADLTWRRVVLSTSPDLMKYSSIRLDADLKRSATQLDGTLPATSAVYVPNGKGGFVTIQVPGTISTVSGALTSSPPAAPSDALEYLSVVGTMQPPKQVSHVWPEVSGTATEVCPDLFVAKGQMILMLDTASQQEQVESDQRLVRELQARLRSIKASPRQASKAAIDVAKVELENAQAQTQFARHTESRLEMLNKSSPGAASQQDLDNAHATRVSAEAQERIARARLDALTDQPKRLDEEIEQTEAQLQTAQQKLLESQKLLNACTVRAPADGLILSYNAVRGQFIVSRRTPGAQEICQIADIDDIVTYVDVPADVASRIDSAGDVNVTDLHGKQIGKGKILRPAPAIDASQPTIQNPVQVRVDNPDWRLYKPGGQVVLNFKLRAATRGSGSIATPFVNGYVTTDGVAVPFSGYVIKDLDNGNTAITDQPVTVDVQPSPASTSNSSGTNYFQPPMVAPSDLTSFRQNVGESFLFAVPATSKKAANLGPVWGNDVYTDDSSLVAAAIHAGAAQLGAPAIVRVTMLPGRPSYAGSTRHGVTSQSYGEWPGSFRVETPTAEQMKRMGLTPGLPVPGQPIQPAPPPTQTGIESHTTSPIVQHPKQRELRQTGEFPGSVVAMDDLLKARAPEKSAAIRFEMDRPSYNLQQSALGLGKHTDSGDPFTARLSDEQGFPRSGILASVSQDIPGSNTVGVYGFLPNYDQKLQPGMPVRVRMTFGPARSEQSHTPPAAATSSVEDQDLHETNLFGRSGTSMLELRKLVETSGALSDSRRRVTRQLLDRLAKLYSDYEAAILKLDKKDPRVVELRQQIEEVAITIVGLCAHTSRDAQVPTDAASPAGPAGAAQARHFTYHHPTRCEIVPFEDFVGHIVSSREGQVGDDKGLDDEPSPTTGVRFEMDERTYGRYQKLMQAGRVKGSGDTFAAGVAGEDDLPRSVTLARFEKRFNPETGSIGVYGTLPNPHRTLLPGMSIRVRVNLGPPVPVLELPLSAVQEEGPVATYVWVVNDQNVVERRTVRGERAREDGNKYVIYEGLSPQDRVIKAAEGLKPGDNVAKTSLYEVLFATPTSTLQNLRKILDSQVASDDPRRAKAEESFDRLMALFVDEEALRKRFTEDDPKVEELRLKIVGTVRDVLELSGVESNELEKFFDR